MGQLIQFGQTVQKIGIDRFDCVEGVVVKGVLLNYAQPYVRNLAYDKTNRCYVECTKEMALKYNLNASPYYYFILASFIPDANNNIIGDREQRVTFLRMNDNQYRHFLAASNNLASWHGYVTLQKKKQKGNDGKDFSFIESSPADDNADGFKGVSQALKARIDRLINDEDFFKTAIQLIDAATGLYEDKYLERIEQNKLAQQQNKGNNGNTGNTGNQLPPTGNTGNQLPPTQTGNTVTTTQTTGNTAYVTAKPVPSTPTAQQDDFGAAADGDLPF